MRVGCYTLALYCDERTSWSDPNHDYDEFPHEFTGHTEARCIRDARKKGWLVGRARDLCPKCVRRLGLVRAS